ncbi:MAG: hypothetical protein H0V10_05690 [Geodermatophilaceae bacterium]|nr:hypothetical protein [Geodermatophilaceae bacterium]
MTPLWLALLDEDPGDADVTPVRNDEGEPVGLLSLWQGNDRPHRDALQADPRLRDPVGPACVLSLAMAPPEARPIADDPAVVHARRQVLRDGRPCAVSLLTADPVSIAGALTVARTDRPEQVAALRDDPFAAIWAARVLRIGAGVFGAPVQPTGPCLERYAGQPWPYDRF